MPNYKFSIETTETVKGINNKYVEQISKSTVTYSGKTSADAESQIKKDFKDDEGFKIIRIQQR